MKALYVNSLKSFIATALLFSYSLIFAQAPDIIWQKCLGGSDNDFAGSIQQTVDGGYIVAGESYSNDGDVTGNHGQGDYWVVKLDANGLIAWQKCLGGSFTDEAKSIQQTTDGGYIVAGASTSNDGDVTGNHGLSDYWVVKLDSNGNIDWQKCLGGSFTDEAKSIQQTADGGYIVAGQSNSFDGDVTGNHGGGGDLWIVKLNANGLITWQKCLGGSEYDGTVYSLEHTYIQQTTDGGYIVAGTSASNDGDVTGNHGLWDYWIVKLDATGLIVWQKCLGGSLMDHATSIKQTTDGGYIVAGTSASNDGDVTGNHNSSDYWIVKLDADGLITWQKSLGGSGSERANFIQQTSDGGYIVAGWSMSIDGDVLGNHSSGYQDYWVVKLDANGIIVWQKCLGGTHTDSAYSVQQTTDGGYIVAGMSASYDGDVTGLRGGLNDYWIVKLGLATGVSTNTILDEAYLYPNPNTGSFLLEGIQEEAYPLDIAVLDINGRAVYQQKYSSYQEQLTLDLQIPKGVYLLQLGNEKGVTHQKFVVE